MKSINKHIKTLLAVAMILLQSCINDDSIFPDEIEGTLSSSTTMVTVLQNFGIENNSIEEESQCFRFVYPIVLGYNTDALITVNSYQGLLEILQSQEINFNITGVQFPFQIVFKGGDTPTTITNETEFLDVLSSCQFNSLRDDINRFRTSCFTLQYPVTLFDTENNEVIQNSEEDFVAFIENQGARYQPDFQFPIIILKEPNFDTELEILSYYGFYRALESCKEVECPEFEVSKELINELSLSYVFFTRPSLDDLVISWSVDGDFITSEVGNQFEFQFETPGTYEICAAIETPECPQGIKKCSVLEIPVTCPELSFEWNRSPDFFEYRFEANFERREDVIYQWFLDGVLIEDDGGPNGDNILVKVLEPGEREVCIKASLPSCPNEILEYCELINVEEDCPELFFVIEQRGDTNIYDFFAEFNGMDSIQYDWFVNDDFIENDGGPEGDNTLVREFEAGTYEICIKAETPECITGVTFCETLVIQ